jgi:threonine dehydrogenase-like Zn-dependent dehydrogenase
MDRLPIEQAVLKNLTLKMGNCNHRKDLPKRVCMVAAGTIDPTIILAQNEPPGGSIDASEAFDQRE